MYGINLDAHGPNLFAAAGNCVVYAVAAICVVHELESGGQRFFHGHRDDISALAVDPEGKIAASGQVTSTTSPAFVCVWEIETCAELFRIGMTQPPAIERMVAALAFTPDSTHLVTVGADDRHSLKVWDLTDEKTPVFEGQAQNGKPPAVWGVHCAPAHVASAFGANDFLVTAGDNHICFWTVMRPKEKGQPYDVESKKGTWKNTPPAKATHAVAFIPHDDMVLTAGEQGYVYMWRDFECQGRFEACARCPCRALWSDEAGLWTAGDDGMIKQWERNKGKYILQQSHQPTGGVPPPDGGAPAAAGGSKPKLVMLKKPAKKAPTAAVRDLVVSEGGAVVLTLTSGALVTLDADSGEEEALLRTHSGVVNHCAVHPRSEEKVATVGDDRYLLYWDIERREVTKSAVLPFGGCAVAISPPIEMIGGHTHIAVGLSGGAMAVYDEETFEQIKFAIHCKEDIDELKYAPNAKYLAVGSHDNYVDLLDVANDYAMLCRLAGHSSYIKHIDWSADSRVIQSVCGGYEVLYWNVATGRQFRSTHDSVESDTIWADWTSSLGFPVMGIYPPDADGTDVNAVHRTRDGRLIAVADDFGAISLFCAPVTCRHAARRQYWGHSSHVTCARFVHGDTYLITCGGGDAAVFVWAIADGDWNNTGPNHKSDSPNEIVMRPLAARPAWLSGLKMATVVDTIDDAAPMV